MFTFVPARTLAALLQKVFLEVRQAIRRLLARSKCLRSEREWPGGYLTHGIHAPSQGTHNNTVERTIRPLVLGRKNQYTSFGADGGGEHAANIYSLTGTCLLNTIDPSAYLRHIRGQIAEHPINRIEALLPWHIAPNLLVPQHQTA